ncbi:MAG: ATP-binding protein [Chloroflexota bacterium]|nr:ATP-binding protein [Chloroflexota bacterium]
MSHHQVGRDQVARASEAAAWVWKARSNFGRAMQGANPRKIDAVPSIDLLDAGIRTLGITTVLVMSLLGFGHSTIPTPGLTSLGEPLLVAAGLVLYNLIIVLAGVPWRHSPGFAHFALDWVVASAAIVITGGFLSPFIILYYALGIGAALRVGLTRSMLLVAGCGVVYAALSLSSRSPIEAAKLPLLVVEVTSLLMVVVTAAGLKRAFEVEASRVQTEKEATDQIRMLNNLTNTVLQASPDLEALLRTVARVSSSALHADSGLAVLFTEYDESGEYGGVQEVRGNSIPQNMLIISDQEPSPPRLSKEEWQMLEESVKTHKPVLYNCAQDGRAQTPYFPGLSRDNSITCTVACVPFVLSGQVLGALFVGRGSSQGFTETEIGLLTAIGQQMAVAVRLAGLYETQRDKAIRSAEREQLERDLLSTVSHELRTPLTAIKTSIGALDSLTVQSGTVARTEGKLIQNIERSTDRLIGLVNELLDMARLQAGRVSLQLELINLGEIAHEIAEQVTPLLDARGQSLSLDLPRRGSERWQRLEIMADRRRIEQLLLNLLANANKYSPQGGNICLGATARDGRVRGFVRDDGPGVPRREQERIFEKYYTSDGRSGVHERPDSTGLGLAIARSIVELHGGEIGVQSTAGQGSLFYFWLPRELGGTEVPRLERESANSHSR